MLTRFFCVVVFLAVVGCAGRDQRKFRRVPSVESGITFRNTLTETLEFNIFNYLYFYNGGGVAIGDVNGDGLPDIFFTANQEPDKLYLNQGDFKFRDVTEMAGVEGFNGWTTGVTMADVNSDGKLDIYVGYLGDYLIYKGRNQLFVNEGNDENGVPKFTDRAMEYGLDLVGFSTQAAFFDYDRDGDLDMFMLNHSVHANGTFGKAGLRDKKHLLAGDRLLRNDDGHFSDITQTAGIYSSALGYGLGIAVSDVNLDGWPDIYVGNDFHENDYLYINQGDGTFKEQLKASMNHTSRYTMGVDFADFNNDVFPDLISTDMLSEDPRVLKSSQAEDTYDMYNFKINFGYHHQFARNALQLNNQNGSFSEIGLLAGVPATDWSWSAMFADYDLDGWKDIFISNGVYRRFNDLDYINFISLDSIQYKMQDELKEKDLVYIEKMPQIKIPNYLYRNNADSTFSNQARAWGLDEASYSNGSAYADLDNDGDLDLVVNNIGDEAFVYENRTLSKAQLSGGEQRPHYLQIRLKGNDGNLQGIGSKVLLYAGDKVQMQECMPTRGYQSSVDDRLTFGIGSTSDIDSVVVVWNDGTFQKLTDVKADQQLVLDQHHSTGVFDYSRFHSKNVIFKNTEDVIRFPYKHHENSSFVEFNREQLIPHMMSTEGPGAAVGDVNGDGMEDIFLGGAKWKNGSILVQGKDGKFATVSQPALEKDSTFEDVDAFFFDADGDHDNDLFVVSGGNEFSGKSSYRDPRLYVNDGRGNMTRSSGLPDLKLTGSAAAADDVDGDGDMDIFLGARTTPWRYGIRPDSYLLINDGKGNFEDATDVLAPVLRKFGFIKDASWADMNGDGKNDLVLAAEWSPITILLNKNSKLELLELENSGLEKSHGWWSTILPFDFDGDGDIDLIAGNLGLNARLHASENHPVKMFAGDFDGNDSTDQVLTHFINGKEYPFHTRDEMTRQMPFLKKRYLSYHNFADATLQDIFSNEVLAASEQYVAYTFASAYIENLGDGKFRPRPLPLSAQFSTVNALWVDDFDGDQHEDVLVAGNFYAPNIQMGRYDASAGLLLKGNGKGSFTAIPGVRSGFNVRGEVRSLKQISVGGKRYYLAVRNNDTVVSFRPIDRQPEVLAEGSR